MELSEKCFTKSVGKYSRFISIFGAGKTKVS